MSSSNALPSAALVFGLASVLVIPIVASEARGGDLMALGFVALALFIGAALGLVGAILALVALKRGCPARGRAIAGLVLSALPLVLLGGIVIQTRVSRPPDLPLAPPAEPPAKPPEAPPASEG